MSELIQKGISERGEDLDLPFMLEQTKNGGSVRLAIEGVSRKVEHTLAFRQYSEDEWILKAMKRTVNNEQEETLKGGKMTARISRLMTSASLGKTTWEVYGSETFEPVPDHQCLVDLLLRHGWTIQRSKEVEGSSRRYVRKPGLQSGSTAVINGGVFSNHVMTTTMGKGYFSYLDLWKHFYK